MQGLQQSNHCQRLHSPPVESTLSTPTHTEERSRGESNLPGWRQKGRQGYGQRRALKSREAPIPLCRNSELDMDNRCIKVNSLSWGPSHPHLGLISNVAAPSPPAASMPTDPGGGRPLHFCIVCCSRHLRAPAPCPGSGAEVGSSADVGSAESGRGVDLMSYSTGIGVLSAPAGHLLRRTAVCSPGFLTSPERLWVGPVTHS